MQQIINEIYQCPMREPLREHLINDMGFSDEDKSIIRSLMYHNADSNFHYDNTGINKDKFERHLKHINRVLVPEVIRLANLQFDR